MVFNTEAEPVSDDEESDDLEKEDGNRKHSALTRQVSLSVPISRDMRRLNPLIVGSRLVVVLNWMQFVPLK